MTGTEQDSHAIKDKAGILIVNEHSIVHHELVRLINRESGLVVCGEADNAVQALHIIKKQRVDLVIVDISLKGITGIQLVEKIRLECPELSVLTISMDNELPCARWAFRAEASDYAINQKAAEQIITAVHYARSLLRSSVFGFTIFVKIERSLNNGHGEFGQIDYKISTGTKSESLL